MTHTHCCLLTAKVCPAASGGSPKKARAGPEQTQQKAQRYVGRSGTATRATIEQSNRTGGLQEIKD